MFPISLKFLFVYGVSILLVESSYMDNELVKVFMFIVNLFESYICYIFVVMMCMLTRILLCGVLLLYHPEAH